MGETATAGSYTGTTEPEQISLLARAQEDVAELGPDLRSAVSLICRYAVELTSGDGALLHLVEGDRLVSVAGAGRTKAIVGLSLPASKSFAGESLRWDETQACDDTLRDDRVDPQVAQRLGIRSLMCHPITVGTVRAGALEVSSTNVSAFGSETAAVMNFLASLVTTAFRNAALIKSRRPISMDPVTGLPDETTYRDRLRLEVERSRRSGSPVAIGIVRLVGYYDDNALGLVTTALSQLRSIDEAFVIDGGTFAVIMPNTPIAGAVIATRKLVAAVTEPLAELGVHVRSGAAQSNGSDANALHDAALHTPA